MKIKEYRYNCDFCNKEIMGRKAYDIYKKTEYKKGLRGFCSVKCYHSDVCKKEISCKNCELKFIPNGYKRKYCSHKCSAEYNNKNRDKNFYKINKNSKCIDCGKNIQITRTIGHNFAKCYDCKNKNSICVVCKSDYDYKKTGNKFCRNQCRDKFIKEQASLRQYREMCKFDFNLKDYASEFDFELVKKYGWYSPANKKNNLGGVSRDHMVSVRYGFDNKIGPEIIKHPANCKIMINSKNISKYKNCSMTLQELKKRIKEWNLKYKMDP